MNHITPLVYSKLFTCPHCQAIAKQDWWAVQWTGDKIFRYSTEAQIRVGKCQNCEENTLWINDTLHYPDSSGAPYPNVEMPHDVKEIYNEAATIYLKSPRGATALLRLAVQILCKKLGESGKNINSDISNLVKKGLPIIVQQSLDIVRVTGNDAVHPGQIDTDDSNTALKLFELLNIIVEYMITLPKKVNELYTNLPIDKINAINKRDS